MIEPTKVKTHPQKTEWAALGGLRFALASIVFWTHFNGYVRLPGILAHVSDAGAFAAVLGFFVVSGYSIAASLQRGSDGFYQRRFARVYPVYFACMILACIPFLIWGLGVGGTQMPSSVWPIVGNFFLLGGIAVPSMPTNPVVWSLVLEAVYYVAALFLNRTRTRWLLALMLVSACAYWFQGSFGITGFNTGLNGSYGVLALLWAWLLGFLLHRFPDNKWVLSGGLLAACILLGRFDQYGAAHFSCAVLVASMLIVAHARNIALPLHVASWFSYAGELSYPLYLCHVPILLMLYGGARQWAWEAGLCAAALCTLTLYHAVDLPYRRYARCHARHPKMPESAALDPARVPVSLAK